MAPESNFVNTMIYEQFSLRKDLISGYKTSAIDYIIADAK
jgi:hypothetical protein